MSKDDGILPPEPKPPGAGSRGDESEPSPAVRSDWSPEQIAASRRVLEVLLASKGLSRKELDAALERPPGSTSRFLRDKEGFSQERLEKMLAFIGVRRDEFVQMRDANLPRPPASPSPALSKAPAPLGLQDVFRKLEEIRQLLERQGLETGSARVSAGPPDGEK